MKGKRLINNVKETRSVAYTPTKTLEKGERKESVRSPIAQNDQRRGKSQVFLFYLFLPS